MGRYLSHASSTGVNRVEFEKKKFYQNVLKYIEDHMTENGFDLVNVSGAEQVYVFHLVKR